MPAHVHGNADSVMFLEKFLYRPKGTCEPRSSFDIPFEIMGIAEDGRHIREIVWARDLDEARKFTARIRGVGDALRLQAFEVVRSLDGHVLRAPSGEAIRKHE